MKKPAPNFLTCPAVPELPPPDKKGGSANGAEKQPAQQKIRPKRKHVLRNIVIVFFLALFLFMIPPGLAFGRALLAGQNARMALENLKAQLELGNYESAQEQSVLAKQALDDFRAALQQVGFFRDVPYVGTQIRTMQDVAAVGGQSLDSLGDLLKVAVALTEAVSAGGTGPDVQIDANRSWNDLSPTEKRQVLSTLEKSLPEIRLARDKIDIALTLWQDVPQENMLPAMRKALIPVAELLPVMRTALDQSVPLIEAVVPLAGYPEPKEYLVVLQNSDEIRPAGGFIGNVGKIKIDAGELTDFQFDDVYNIDNPVSGVWNEVPPEPLAKNLAVKAWFMRDANWSPDFAVSAARVLDFYIREQALNGKSENSDGVIALEPGFFRGLLRLTGPIQIEGKSYDDKNFMDLIEYEVEIGFLEQGISLEDRKAIINDIGKELSRKIQNMPRSDWPKLINLLTSALQEKQIMVYSQDAALQSLMDKRDWSGRTKATDCDFVWVIDANLAALKTDGKMIKEAAYTLDASNPEATIATLSLKYQNTTTKIDWRYTRYRSYTRVYVPEGSVLISSSGAMQGDLLQTGGRKVEGKVDVMKDLGKTVFGAFWAIEPGKVGELSFTYHLPASAAACLNSGTYVLDWPKQPGVDNLQTSISAKLPREVLTAEPAEPESKWGDNYYQVESTSRTDQEFIVKF